MVIKSCKTQTL